MSGQLFAIFLSLAAVLCAGGSIVLALNTIPYPKDADSSVRTRYIGALAPSAIAAITVGLFPIPMWSVGFFYFVVVLPFFIGWYRKTAKAMDEEKARRELHARVEKYDRNKELAAAAKIEDEKLKDTRFLFETIDASPIHQRIKDTFKEVAINILNEEPTQAAADKIRKQFVSFSSSLDDTYKGAEPEGLFQLVRSRPTDPLTIKNLWHTALFMPGKSTYSWYETWRDGREQKGGSDTFGVKDIEKGDLDATLDFIEFLPARMLSYAVAPIVHIPEETRFRHTFIVGPTGSGKTQLMQYLISKDLEKECSVIVIDSSKDMIEKLGTLRDYQDRMILIQPDNFAINPFSLKDEQAVDLLTYVFAALGDTFTSTQDTLYRFCIRLLQVIPGATLNTFLAILEPRGLEPYREYVSKLSGPAQRFFNSQFDDFKQYGDTKQQVTRRLMYLLENTSFERMFCSPSRFDLFEELKTPKLILIDTDIAKLQQRHSSVMGRFFLALILLTARQRLEQSQADRFPVFCYVDEMQEYQDDTIKTLLQQVRKARLGFTFATQQTSNITSSPTLDALLDAATIFANTKNPTDTHRLAPIMGTKPDKLYSSKEGIMSIYTRAVPQALQVYVPGMVIERMDHVSIEPLRQRMKRLYGPSEVAPPIFEEEPPPIAAPKLRRPTQKKAEPEEDDEDEITPSSKL